MSKIFVHVRKYAQFTFIALQTHHVDSTLKLRGNGRFHVAMTWNPRGVFVGRVHRGYLEKPANYDKCIFKRVQLFVATSSDAYLKNYVIKTHSKV